MINTLRSNIINIPNGIKKFPLIEPQRNPALTESSDVPYLCGMRDSSGISAKRVYCRVIPLISAGLAAVIMASGCATAPQAKEIKKSETTATATVNVKGTVVEPGGKACLSENARSQVNLEWKFLKGNEYKYKMTQEMMSQTSAPMMDEQTMAMKQVINYSQKVLDVDAAGSGTLETTYDTVKLNADIPMLGKIKFDSTNAEDVAALNDSDPAPHKMFFRPFFVLIGKKFTVTMDKSARVLDVKGITEFMDELLKGNERFAEQIRASFGDKWYYSLMTQANTRLPASGIAKGESWTNEIEIPVPMAGSIKLLIKSTYTGEELYMNRMCARIDDQITLSFNLEELEQLSEKIKIEWTNNSGTRTSYFDTQAGTLVRSEANMRLTMDVAVKQDSSKEEGIEKNDEPQEEDTEKPDKPEMAAKEMKMKNDININITLELQE
ncbi:MAG: DUF6263 family protein [Planctomycetota bacterium]